MKLRMIAVLGLTLLMLSACVVAPYGGGGYYQRGYNMDSYSQHDYGRRVWPG